MTRRFSLLVFDWDGTLMDSEARIVACMQAAMRALDLEPMGAESIRRIIGLGIGEAVRALYPQADAGFVARFADAYRVAFMEASSVPQALFPGVEGVLGELEAAGYLLAVATGKGRSGLDRGLRESGLGARFHATRCADESRSKPHPAMLEELMERCGVSPRETLMIGDTTFDLDMARNAGASAVGVSYGVHPVEHLLGCEPLTILHAITDLPVWLGSDVGSRASATQGRAESR